MQFGTGNTVAVQLIEKSEEADTLPVLLLTPTGQDAIVARRVLEGAGFTARICNDMGLVCDLLRDDEAGVILLAEEALAGEGRAALSEALDCQPSWSDVPIILLTGQD